MKAMTELPYSMGRSVHSHNSLHDDQQSITVVSLDGGNTTERSSMYSLEGEDEFEREATQEVKAMFHAIDRSLYENETGPSHLSSECSEWASVFPHLRMMGQQVMAPNDPGYQMVDTGLNQHSILQDVTEQDTLPSTSLHQLAVLGQHASVHQQNHLVDSMEHFEPEEIFDEDGHVEDVLAIDYKSLEDDSHSTVVSEKRRSRGLPPVTPSACVRDNIGGAAFDYLWTEAISWLRNTTTQYANLLIFDMDDMNDHHIDISHDILHGYHPSIQEYPYIRESLDMSLKLTEKKSADGMQLDDLLKISTKALNTREKSLLVDHPDTPDRSLSTFTRHRPMSGFKLFEPQMRPFSVKGERLSSAKMKNNPKSRLAPLSMDRVKTPSVEDERNPRLTNEGVRGRAITAINKDHGSPPPGPPTPFSRNGALPPIGLDLDLQAGIPHRKKTNLRASSAVHNDKEASRLHLKERENTVLGITLDNRPSTTHGLYRSDTPLGLAGRRSSTPLGFNTLRVSQHNLPMAPIAAADSNPNLNVTGSSINAQLDQGIHPETNLILEDADASYEESALPHRWVATNLHPRIRRSKTQSFVR